MTTTRRHILALTGSGFLSRLFGASFPSSNPSFDVDRLIETHTGNRAGNDCRREVRRYTASATVMLFSIPLVSRASVGSGYAVVEEAGQTLSIQFGAGSYPESARGLNRLGFIQEAVVEGQPGRPSECAWLAFMTTSQEKNLDQAKKALEASGAMVPYSASQGYGRQGRFHSRVDRLEFPSKYTWRDISRLVEEARGSMTCLKGDEQAAGQAASEEERPATFLYLVRRALLDPKTQTSSFLVFNGKEFQLDAEKEADAGATAHFSEKKLVAATASAMRLNATLREKKTGIRTPFRVWYEAGKESLPLRFEYQAKSFLRLTFEADAAAAAPPIRFAFKRSGLGAKVRPPGAAGRVVPPIHGAAPGGSCAFEENA
jgi:hypothetical protein